MFDPCLSPVCSLCCPQRVQLYCFSQHCSSNQTHRFAAGEAQRDINREDPWHIPAAKPHHIPHSSCRILLLSSSSEQGIAPQTEHMEDRVCGVRWSRTAMPHLGTAQGRAVGEARPHCRAQCTHQRYLPQIPALIQTCPSQSAPQALHKHGGDARRRNL